MKTQAELYTAWQTQLPELTIAVMNKIIAPFPMVQNDVAVPVIWSRDGDNFKAELPIIGEDAIVIISPDAVYQYVNYKVAQHYIPSNIKAAILSLAPDWVMGSTAYGSPVKSIRRVVETHNLPWSFTSGYVAGVDVNYQIQFDTPNITAEVIKKTDAYLYPVCMVGEAGNIIM